MIKFPGIKVLAQIYETANSLVYRGLRERDNQPIILKLLKEDYPTPAELFRYQQEYQITRRLNLKGVVKAYDLQNYQNTLVMLLEDFGGVSLDILLEKSQFTFYKFLNIAIQVTEILGEIHHSNIIHKDINPSNIVLNTQTEELKIIDFGLSTILPRERTPLKNPNVLEGTLAYISPEQTGRMNRAIDYRTDFYSLGVTFYEMLTNQLPFDNTDAMELVHCHIAKLPIPPHELNPEISLAVSAIVMKLLAKTAEERYQSAWGIKSDLEECLLQLQNNNQILGFPLGRHDISGKFQIPQKLYGREAEVETLLAAFERVTAGERKSEVSRMKDEMGTGSNPEAQALSDASVPNPEHPTNKAFKTSSFTLHTSEMMLVSGYSGIGKSALVQEIYKPITERRGYFISGKFDQLERNIPYSAIVSAFSDLVRQLLTETEASLAQWREKLLTAFGANGQVIIDVIPEVEVIVGQQLAVPELAPTESQNRFNLVFQNFIRVFTQPEHPLVMFIDDLQWADVPSLKLIKLLMTAPDNPYLFFIGAYRDNEVSEVHPLMLTVDAIRQAGVRVDRIFLSPLDLSNVNQLISDTLTSPPDQTIPLAELVLFKTGGNPFFMNEFLKSLYAEKLIKFDFTPKEGSQGGWQWDLEQIKARDITDNVVELMASKIQKLRTSTQRVLQIAAAIGNQFDLQTLAIVLEKSQKETVLDLHEAVAESLVFPLSDAYKILEEWELGTGDWEDKGTRENSRDRKLPITHHQSPTTIEYKFAHDRIQQAAYSLIPAQDKQAVHWQVGQLLRHNTPPQVFQQKIFDIVNHLNFGFEFSAVQSHRGELAQLNLIAGKKAKASAAYESAWNYLRISMKCLSADSWIRQYDLTLALYVEAAEVAYLSSNFEEMERLASIVLQQAKTLLDKVNVYEVKIQACTAHNKPLEAVKTARSILVMLGINFPKKPNKIDILLKLLRTKLRLAGKQIEDLIELPEMTDPYKLAAMRILSDVAAAAYFAVPELFPLIVFEQVKLSLEYGNTSTSSYAYATYGLILSGEVVGDVESGYQFGQLALGLLDKFNTKELKAKTFLIVNFFIRHWKEHLKETLTPLLDAYLIGLETGDLEYAAYSASAYTHHSYILGKELAKLEREMAMYSNALSQLGQETGCYYIQLNRQVVLNLMGRAEDKCRLIGESYDEDKMLPIHLEANAQNICHSLYFYKLFLGYLFQDYRQALDNASLSEQSEDSAVGSIPLAHFYTSLVYLATYPDAPKSEQKRILLKVKSNLKQLKKWARNAPMTHLHKFYLVEAEQHRVLGHKAEAVDSYDKAIKLAKEHEYINEEALAHELAAKFYLALDKAKIAQVYMLDARYCYRKWGAVAKVKELEARYPQLLSKKSDSRTTAQLRLSVTNSGNESSEVLDLATVMKASQTLTEEIVLDKLLAKLMRIIIENAGAQKGFLILETQGKLLIEAEASVDEEGVTVLPSIPIKSVWEPGDKLLISHKIVNYVARTRESVVFSDAANEPKFANSPYIKTHQSKSILCFPLQYQGKLAGIIYLENNLTTDAFTPNRVEVLNLLSSQAAISLENARLYNNMAELNQAFERFVPRQFLQFLDKKSIVDVQLGDQVQQEMSVLFSDIRDFTSLSESMTPQDNFKFINAYLSRMEPAIIENQGFIDKYIGDAIMALFSGEADNAVKAGIDMLHRLAVYNQHRVNSGYLPIKIGIGINTGSLMLGTVGGKNRMDSTVISDAVNLASRVESSSKNYGASMLITQQTFACLQDSNQYDIRIIDRIQVKGKSKTVSIFEVFDADPPEIREGKLVTRAVFEEALSLYNLQKVREAEQLFAECLRLNPMDKAAQIHRQRCIQYYLNKSSLAMYQTAAYLTPFKH